MARVFFILLIAAAAWFWNEFYIAKAVSAVAGLGIFFFVDRYVIQKVAFYKLFTTSILLVILFALLSILLYVFGLKPSFVAGLDPAAVNVIVSYLIIYAIYVALNYGSSATYFRRAKAENEETDTCLVDTSAIIDGRILNVCRMGFVSRHLVIPTFVVHEMQLIADSPIHEKRKKGRRGLNILRKIKECDDLSINLDPTDYEELRGVDNKLLRMAKDENCKIITTDFNLVKVAEVQGIEVLNVNRLATILKPQHAVGDKVKVHITKKGNSKRQGVGYLDDDTMVVVDDGEKFINQSKMAIVTAYIQSETGKMMFCKLIQ